MNIRDQLIAGIDITLDTDRGTTIWIRKMNDRVVMGEDFKAKHSIDLDSSVRRIQAHWDGFKHNLGAVA
jgi:hypothetical protein